MAPLFAGKFRSICMKNLKDDFSLQREPMHFKFNRLNLLVNIFSFQFTESLEYQPSSSYRVLKSRFFPYIHCKFCPVCPATKMTLETVKPSIDQWNEIKMKLAQSTCTNNSYKSFHVLPYHLTVCLHMKVAAFFRPIFALLEISSVFFLPPSKTLWE